MLKLLIQIALLLSLLQHNTLDFDQINVLWPGTEDAWQQWRISTSQGQGDLKTLWSDDPSQWQFNLPGLDGKITQLWYGDDRTWQLKAKETTLTIKQIWNNDPTQWEISNNDQTITVKTIWSGSDSWKSWTVTSQYGSMDIRTTWQSNKNAWQQWTIQDNMPNTEPEFKMAAIFIVIYTSLKINNIIPQ